MDPPSSVRASTAHPENHHNVNVTNTTSMFVERDQFDDQSQESDRGERSEQRRKIKLAMLMQQLEFLFYALVVLCYTLDGKNLIFILRTVSEVQFSQPKQIQPDRPLSFFALASLVIFFCALSSHLSLISSPNYNPSGIFVDFIGQFTRNHPLVIVAFLIGLDVCSCLVQLLLVLISFTQSHSIPISVNTTDTHPHTSPNISPDHDDIEANPTTSKSSDLDPALNLRTDDLNERGEARRRGLSRVTHQATDFQDDSFLFDLTISQVKALLFSTDSPTNHNSSATASSSPTPTSTPRPSRALDSSQAPTIPTDTRPVTETNHNPPENRDQGSNPQLSTEQAFIVTNLPPRTVIIPIV